MSEILWVSADGEESRGLRVGLDPVTYEQALRDRLEALPTERIVSWANYMTHHWREQRHLQVAERVAREWVATRWPSRWERR